MTSGNNDPAESAVELLRNSRETYSSVLSIFQQCRNLGLRSGLLSKCAILNIDQCALSFLFLGTQTVGLAEIVSNQWLDQVLHFYNYISISSHNEIVQQLKLLGGQAKNISEWCRNPAGCIHKPHTESGLPIME